MNGLARPEFASWLPSGGRMKRSPLITLSVGVGNGRKKSPKDGRTDGVICCQEESVGRGQTNASYINGRASASGVSISMDGFNRIERESEAPVRGGRTYLGITGGSNNRPKDCGGTTVPLSRGLSEGGENSRVGHVYFTDQ